MSLRGQLKLKREKKKGIFDRLIERLLPFDHLVIIYCWIIIILAVNFARPFDRYIGLAAFHLGAIAVVCIVAYFLHGHPRRPAVFLRIFYPVVLMTFFYQFVGSMVQSVISGWLDIAVVEFEQSILGANPTLWLDGRLSGFVTELMSAGYFSYYFMIPGLCLFLFFHKKDRESKRFVTATCATFFLSYLIFIFFPVTGPRFYLAEQYQNMLPSGFFRDLVMAVIDGAAFRGGAMPSSHVAEAVVVMLFALKVYGRRAAFMVPLVALLAAGTVYGRFHYVTDVAVGIIIGLAVPLITLFFYPIEKEKPEPYKFKKKSAPDKHVPDSI